MDHKLSNESDVTLKGGIFNTFKSYCDHREQKRDREGFAGEFNDTSFMRDGFGRQNNNDVEFVTGLE